MIFTNVIDSLYSASFIEGNIMQQSGLGALGTDENIEGDMLSAGNSCTGTDNN
jgi:hypothetical protein